MTSRSKAVLGMCALALDLVLGLWFWALDPDGARRLIPVVVVGVLWAFAEFAQGPADSRRGPVVDWHRTVFATIALVLALRMGVRLAVELEVVGAGWVPTLRRGFGVLGGVLLGVWGNYLPKLLSPWRPEEQPFDWQGVHRFVGWLATLSGLGIAVVWLTLPIPVAGGTAVAIMLTFVILAFGRKLVSLASSSSRPPLAS
jgi:hypothetical protein